MTMTTTLGQSRAVVRQIEPGNTTLCDGCGETLKFVAKVPSAKRQKVICNVYEDGVWKRVEQFHRPCYEDAGYPHGEPIIDQKLSNGRPHS